MYSVVHIRSTSWQCWILSNLNFKLNLKGFGWLIGDSILHSCSTGSCKALTLIFLNSAARKDFLVRLFPVLLPRPDLPYSLSLTAWRPPMSSFIYQLELERYWINIFHIHIYYDWIILLNITTTALNMKYLILNILQIDISQPPRGGRWVAGWAGVSSLQGGMN